MSECEGLNEITLKLCSRTFCFRIHIISLCQRNMRHFEVRNLQELARWRRYFASPSHTCLSWTPALAHLKGVGDRWYRSQSFRTGLDSIQPTWAPQRV